MGTKVQLYVYDLSKGMARMLSMQLTGTQIDAIWHTAVVVNGREYYFGSGIEVSMPGQTHLGPPQEIVDMGETMLPEDVVEAFVESMKEIYTPDKYHLLENNCNSFSNEFCNFLVGKDIPSHITGLPAQFLSTPFGQSLRPFIDNMFRPNIQPTAPAPQAASAFQPSTTAQQAPASVSTATAAAILQPILCTASSLPELDAILARHRCVVVDFTSMTCPPCRAIAPEFERLLEEHQRYKPVGVRCVTLPRPMIVGVKVEVGTARDIATRYGITATPTFVYFLDGKQFAEFKGADRHELRSNMELLLYTAYPSHPHARVATPTLEAAGRSTVLFVQSSQVEAIFKKLKEFVSPDDWARHESQLFGLQRALGEHKGGRIGEREKLNLPPDWHIPIEHLLSTLPVDKLFPLLDIVRILILDDQVRSFFVDKDPNNTLMKLFYRFGSIGSEGTAVPRTVHLMLLRVACNLFSSPAGVAFVLDTQKELPAHNVAHRNITTAVLIETLLSDDIQVKQGASALCLNIALEERKLRTKLLESAGATGTASLPMEDEDEILHEEWCCEVLAAALQALIGTRDDDALIRLASSVAHIVRYGTPTLIELGSTLVDTAALDKLKAEKRGEAQTRALAAEREKAGKAAKLLGELSELLTVS
ncbi:thioredoxin family protein [Polychytrium aggregatum]|uniref:thioredoxin family protein n=1 Tax=Polychytrium aggregatum TaxID=110093 RepID=UPI0022FF3137|nr:thioredoxin family protein [Polychytrium aggregatum]KAI9199595.1 thioredoxin family protein [Polychytrium aggregatum]